MVVREDRDRVAVIRLAHGKVSALDAALTDRLTREIDAVRTGDFRGLILTGTGSAFSAGVDLFQVVEGGAEYVRRFLPLLDALMRAVLTFPRPIVAAINGHAIAGGCIVAAACDHRIMAEGNGRIGVPELAVGVPFPALALEIVASRVAPTALRHLVFTGRTVEVGEAVEHGLVDEPCEPGVLMERAGQVIDQLCTVPPTTFELTKRAFYTPLLQRVRQMSAVDAEAAEAWTSPETLKAVKAYLDRTVRKKS